MKKIFLFGFSLILAVAYVWAFPLLGELQISLALFPTMIFLLGVYEKPDALWTRLVNSQSATFFGGIFFIIGGGAIGNWLGNTAGYALTALMMACGAICLWRNYRLPTPTQKEKS